MIHFVIKVIWIITFRACDIFNKTRQQGNIHVANCILLCKIIENIQFTLPKSKSHKSNNHPSWRSISGSLFFIFVFDPTYVKFSLSQRYFFSPNGFDLGRINCALKIVWTKPDMIVTINQNWFYKLHIGSLNCEKKEFHALQLLKQKCMQWSSGIFVHQIAVWFYENWINSNSSLDL